MNRAEVLKIYRESCLHENVVKLIFDRIMDTDLNVNNILVPDAGDGTIVWILLCCGYDLSKVYVTETDKARRAGLHRQRIKIVDDRAIKDIDVFRGCGSYRRYPGCIGCPQDKSECPEYGVKFDTAIVLREYATLQKHAGNIIIIPGGTNELQ